MGADAGTAELRDAHDVLAPVYAELLADHLDRTPVERHLLSLFAELVHGGGAGVEIGDIGCGTGRLMPFLASLGLEPRGVDLSPEMVATARRAGSRFPVEVADLRALPFGDASLAGAVAWYSLMYLPPNQREGAYAELARVVVPGGHLVTAFKLGDDTVRRGAQTLGLGIGFDIWWMSRDEVESRLTAAGFSTVLWSERPADPDEQQAQGYLIARRDA